MKLVFPTAGVWDGSSKIVDDDATTPTGFTEVPPIQPAYKIIFNAQTQKWEETASPDEIKNWYSDAVPVPDDMDGIKQMLGSIVQSNIQRDNDIKQIKSILGNLETKFIADSSNESTTDKPHTD